MAEGLGLLKKEEPCRMVRCGSEANGGAAGKAAPPFCVIRLFSFFAFCILSLPPRAAHSQRQYWSCYSPIVNFNFPTDTINLFQ